MLEISGIGILSAFTAGTISFLSPCVLPLVPGYVSFVAGKSIEEIHDTSGSRPKLSTLTFSLLFVAGFSTVFILLGASATALGRILLTYRYETNIIGGIIVIAFGLFMIGLVKFPWFQGDLRYHGEIKGARPLACFSLGLAFAFGWTPCIGPVLGAILTVSAMSSNSFDGIVLLSIYSLGLGVPFIAAAIFANEFLRRMKVLRSVGRPLQIFAGTIMIIMGTAMITGYMQIFAYWLLNTFPVFTSIG
jgi:cytochrome c-type biogenesis protein